jgi:hypothetical protein
VKRPPRPTHSYLTDTEVRTLDVLVRRGARALRPEECNKLISLFQHHVGDLQQARRSATGMRTERGGLRRRAEAAETRIALALAVLDGHAADSDEVRQLAHEIREALAMTAEAAR